MKFREIERLRGIAVLMVIFTHVELALGHPGGIFGYPRTGVDLFFVISGFVVTRSLIRLLPDLTAVGAVDAAFDLSRSALRIFYARRFFRIIPLVVGLVVVQRSLFLLGLPSSVLGGDLDMLTHEVFALFTGVYNYAMPSAGWDQLGFCWSLTVEEHFYLILPLSFLFARTRAKRIGLTLFAIVLVGLVFRNFFDTPPAGTARSEFYPYWSSHMRFDSLFAGTAVALLFNAAPAKPIMPKAFMKWFALPACVGLICAVPRSMPLITSAHLGLSATWFLSAILVTYASFDQGYVFEMKGLGRVLEYLGGRSYGLYMLHFPVMRLDHGIGLYIPAYHQFSEAYPWAHFGVQMVGFLVAAELSWRLLELPMQQFGRRLEDASLPQWELTPAWRMGLAAAAVSIVLLSFHHPIGRLVGRKNLALQKPVTTSSVNSAQPDPQQLTNGSLESELGMHTQTEANPWAVIDLGAVMPVGTIVTYNRADNWENEVLPLTVELSSDGTTYAEAGTRTGLFSQWLPWRLRVGGAGGTQARYVRYRGPKDGYLCLAESEVFAP